MKHNVGVMRTSFFWNSNITCQHNPEFDHIDDKFQNVTDDEDPHNADKDGGHLHVPPLPLAEEVQLCSAWPVIV